MTSIYTYPTGRIELPPQPPALDNRKKILLVATFSLSAGVLVVGFLALAVQPIPPPQGLLKLAPLRGVTEWGALAFIVVGTGGLVVGINYSLYAIQKAHSSRERMILSLLKALVKDPQTVQTKPAEASNSSTSSSDSKDPQTPEAKPTKAPNPSASTSSNSKDLERPRAKPPKASKPSTSPSDAIWHKVQAGEYDAALRLFQEHGIDLKRPLSTVDWTLLHYVARDGSLETARQIIGADLYTLDCQDISGFYPYDCAQDNTDHDMMALLKRWTIGDVLDAIKQRDCDELNRWLQWGGNINCKDRRGTPLFHTAITEVSDANPESLKVVSWFLQNGVDLTQWDEVVCATAYHCAISKHSSKIAYGILAKLLDYTPDPYHALSQLNREGKTPLHIALGYGYRELVLDLFSSFPKTALALECENSEGETVREQLQNKLSSFHPGPPPYLPDITSKAEVLIAIQYGNEAVIQKWLGEGFPIIHPLAKTPALIRALSNPRILTLLLRRTEEVQACLKRPFYLDKNLWHLTCLSYVSSQCRQGSFNSIWKAVPRAWQSAVLKSRSRDGQPLFHLLLNGYSAQFSDEEKTTYWRRLSEIYRHVQLMDPDSFEELSTAQIANGETPAHIAARRGLGNSYQTLIQNLPPSTRTA